VAWLSIRLPTPAARIERLSEELLAAGAQSVTLHDAGDTPVLEPAPGETPLWSHTEVDALFALDVDVAVIRTALDTAFDGAPPSFDVRFIEDVDWTRAWRSHATPRLFGDRLWILPCDAPAPRDARAMVRLDPGLAFGTGEHATTALCLEWLARRDLTGRTIVDFGSGSGILGIAAIALGAQYVTAIDHDPQALIATRANATYNGIALHRLRVVMPDEMPPTPHDIVLANILAGPLTTLAPVLTAWVRPRGALVMSGMLAHQLDAVVHCYDQFAFERAQIRDSWVLVEGTKAGG